MSENIIDIEEIKEEDYISGAEEQLAAITSMVEDRDKKVETAVKHLVDTLRVAAAKYRTASGVMNAMNTIHSVHDKVNFKPALAEAQRLASAMSANAKELAGNIEKYAIDNGKFNKVYLDTALDNCYDADFVEDKSAGVFDVAYQLLLLEMCRSIGGNIQDVVDFYETTEEEIAKATHAYEDYCEEHNINLVGD